MKKGHCEHTLKTVFDKHLKPDKHQNIQLKQFRNLKKYLNFHIDLYSDETFASLYATNVACLHNLG